MANERRRLIDACKLDILGYLEEFPICDEDKGWNSAINSVFAHVVCAPTVDAVEVVRCAKCKHYEEPYCMLCKSRIGASYWSRDMAYRKPDDFCSYGKKSGTQPQREDV